jgi:S1-C subfamily serine protease
MMPQASELSLSPGAREEITSMEGDTEYQNIISSVSQQFSSDGTVISAIPSSQIQTTTRSIPSVGPLPEPEPNVIMMPSAPAASQNPPMVPSSSGTDVPLINSANPDNFYVLYSQLNYNVVM